MGAALNTASASNAYVLADRGTWLSFKNRGDLDIVVEGDKRLFNQYGVMLVNPEKHPHVKKELGQAFIDWLVSPEGQKAIADYKINGQQLFFPNANVAGARDARLTVARSFGGFAVLAAMTTMTIPAGAADPVLLHAAGSLRSALTEVAAAFEAAAGHKVQAKFGASGTLKDEIARASARRSVRLRQHGAPAGAGGRQQERAGGAVRAQPAVRAGAARTCRRHRRRCSTACSIRR